MGLFGSSKKKQYKTTNNGKSNSSIFGENLDKLTPDGELPFGWYYANKEFTNQIQAEYDLFSEEYCLSKSSGGVIYHYKALKSLVKYMEDVKNLCIAKGECFAKWSETVVANQGTIDERKEELNILERNLDELIKREKEVEKIKSELLRLISNEPGIVQSELYKRFDADLKNTISNELYQMEVKEVIIREKSGMSYKLSINE